MQLFLSPNWTSHVPMERDIHDQRGWSDTLPHKEELDEMHDSGIADLSTAARDSKHRREDYELYWPNLELDYRGSSHSAGMRLWRGSLEVYCLICKLSVHW